MKKLVKNAAQCKHCGVIIESTHVHDFKECECGCIYVDGGLHYCRRGFKNGPDDIIDMSIWKDI